MTLRVVDRTIFARSPIRAAQEAGFTLVETMVALGVMSMVMLIMSSSFLTNLRSNLNMQIRYEAIQAAQRVLDDARFGDPSLLPATGSVTQNVTIGTRTYTVTTTYCKLATFCISTDIRHLTFDVDYKSQRIYETDTAFSKLR
jgi:prepilin-type N-terminal cleavage/methylation domain-containing protein